LELFDFSRGFMNFDSWNSCNTAAHEFAQHPGATTLPVGTETKQRREKKRDAEKEPEEGRQ
jgi:hypothetical protein